MSTTHLVEVDDLHKSYGSRHVLRGVRFTVDEGEVLGILGANGAGKTTAIECLQGLRRPDRGTLRVLGMDPQRQARQLRRLVGSQLQDAALPDRLRAGEAVRLFGPSGVDVEAALVPWGLVGQRDTAFGDLSGGQRQRLFIALALLGSPRVVFLDELTQGLDPVARSDVWDAVRDVRRRGATVVLVTHFLDEAEALCDRLVVMQDGRVVADGAPGELVRQCGAPTRVRWRSGDGRPLDGLERVPGVRTVRFDGCEVEVEGDDRIVAHLGAALVARGDAPPLQVHHPRLDDAVAAFYPGGAR